jgi:hypothetical protein
MASTALWWQARGGWRPEDEALVERVRRRTDCGGCGLPQVVEDGVCVDCGWKAPAAPVKAP